MAEPTEEKQDYFEIANALLIAIVTLIGAFVAWQASVADDSAGDASLDGLMAERNLQETVAIHWLEQLDNYRAYTTYTRYERLGYEINNDLANPDLSEEELETLVGQQRTLWTTGDVALQSFPIEYLKWQDADYTSHTYDMQRALGEAMGDASRNLDLIAQPHFEEADRMLLKSNRLLQIATALAASLVFFALASELNGRIVKYTMAAIGLLITLGSIVAIIIIW
jgi:hypothetical protein